MVHTQGLAAISGASWVIMSVGMRRLLLPDLGTFHHLNYSCCTTQLYAYQSWGGVRLFVVDAVNKKHSIWMKTDTASSSYFFSTHVRMARCATYVSWCVRGDYWSWGFVDCGKSKAAPPSVSFGPFVRQNIFLPLSTTQKLYSHYWVSAERRLSSFTQSWLLASRWSFTLVA